MTKKRVFVTGANGLLGRAVLDELLTEGYDIRALVRRQDALSDYPNKDRIDQVIGDMENVAGFAPHLAGCDAVMHLAAFHREYLEGSKDLDLLERINVTGTMDMIKASEQAGVTRFIFASSAGVMKRTGRPTNEQSSLDLKTSNAYFASKVRAEKEIDKYLAKQPAMAVVIARPSMMLGPQDPGPTVAGTFVRNFIESKNAVVLPGFAVVIDSRDVASAMVAMIDLGRSGERFVLGGKKLSFLDLNERLQRLTGVDMPKGRPPYPVAWAVMALRGLLGLTVPLKHSEIRFMQRLVQPDSNKMLQRLRISPRPIDETLNDTVAWFRKHPSKA